MKGDILVCYGNTLLDRFISFVLGGRAVHVALCIEDDLVIESIASGISVNKISEKGLRRYCILRPVGISEEQLNTLIKNALLKVNKKYDFKLAFSIFLHSAFGIKVSWNDPDKYVCSEFILNEFRTVGFDLLEDFPTDNVEPEDFYYSNKLVHVDKL